MEVYRDIEGYEGVYQVSNYGNVKSLARDVEWKGTIRHQPERILKPAADGHGYLYVHLYNEGKTKSHFVHRLVASAFIENPDNLPQVNHKDECPTNNCLENLEWCTCEYNSNYGTRNERIAEAQRGIPKPLVAEALRGKPCPWVAEALSIPVDMLTKDGEFIRSFKSAAEAMRWLRNNGYHKADKGSITKSCKGNRNTHCGFKWRYTKGN